MFINGKEFINGIGFRPLLNADESWLQRVIVKEEENLKIYKEILKRISPMESYARKASEGDFAWILGIDLESIITGKIKYIKDRIKDTEKKILEAQKELKRK